VTVHVRRLREKIEVDAASPTRIATVWGVGYRWDPAPESSGDALSRTYTGDSGPDA
jgi:DNA-binding winged helix-turn-helix (wHTH) protein